MRNATRPVRTLTALGLALLLAACQTWARVDPEPLNVGDAYVVRPDIVWSALRFGDTHHLTVDGLNLQRMILSANVEEGDPLITLPSAASSQTPKLPLYDSDLSILELADFTKTTLTALGFERVETANIRPSRLGGKDGLALDFEMVSKNGLSYRGFARIVRFDGAVHAAIYFGAALYHYEKHAPNARHLVRSLQWVDDQA